MRLVFLGTSSSEPTRTRNVSGVALRFGEPSRTTFLTGSSGGKSWLFDCGEGTQRQIGRVQALTTCTIERIFVTHMHGDHVFGLPGLLCNIVHNSPGGHPPIAIYGPPGLRRYLFEALRLTTAAVPPYFVRELHSCRSTAVHKDDLMCEQDLSDSADRWKLHEDSVCAVYAGAITHRVDCWGYVITEKTAYTLDPVKAEGLGVQRSKFAELKMGQTVTAKSGVQVRMEDVTGATRAGRKLVLLGDTCDPSNVAEMAQGADVLVHESTYDDSLRALAIERGHSTAAMAGEFAAQISAAQLILTHFSARYRNQMAIQSMVADAKSSFGSENVMAADDFLEVVVPRKERALV
eukprot:TRINITY_DN5601_c0_g1_i2.p1 TRINITY_DN5601_c0_g1~~TRINITY_DN5601_c0_g1_i2.p1  ORF type:complete len:349 (-),score=84.55 TRINITY_DN5601_c0_g1_i2:175-1221(-)